MNRFLRYSLALALSACTVPDFTVLPAGDSGSAGAGGATDPCVTQMSLGKLCGGACTVCQDGQSCDTGTDCASTLCEVGVCSAMPTCSDGKVNAAETDTDCGGGTCSSCGLTAHCTRASDCQSKLCDAGSCAAMPTCSDVQINGAETDTDCGGGTCATCALDKRCTRSSDCESALCKAGVCSTPSADPTCNDKQKNATETDTDCGGICDPCPVDKRCSIGADCVSLVCASVCQPAGCKDGVRNGDESDKDCGGSCGGCAVGLVCKTGVDCTSLSCYNGHCIASSCSDKIKNGSETGKDCGGGSCAVCPPNEGCGKPSDCDSLVCAANKTCSAATCSDGVKNGSESVIDCGKGCKGCQTGQFCNTGADCASATCTQNYCVPSAPSGGALAMTNWTATASDTFSTAGPGSAIDSKGTTRWSSGTEQYPGMWFAFDMKQNQFIFGIDLDTQDQASDAPALLDVYLSTDGNFSTPILKSVTSGADGLTHISFGKALVARYVKLVLTKGKSPSWWGIEELSVFN